MVASTKVPLMLAFVLAPRTSLENPCRVLLCLSHHGLLLSRRRRPVCARDRLRVAIVVIVIPNHAQPLVACSLRSPNLNLSPESGDRGSVFRRCMASGAP